MKRIWAVRYSDYDVYDIGDLFIDLDDAVRSLMEQEPNWHPGSCISFDRALFRSRSSHPYGPFHGPYVIEGAMLHEQGEVAIDYPAWDDQAEVLEAWQRLGYSYTPNSEPPPRQKPGWKSGSIGGKALAQ